MLRSYLALVVVAASAGCYADEDEFSARMAELQCVHWQACLPAVFDRHEDVDDCADALVDADFLQLHEGCYEAPVGRACVRAYRRQRHDCQLMNWTWLAECKPLAQCLLYASSLDSPSPDAVLRGD